MLPDSYIGKPKVGVCRVPPSRGHLPHGHAQYIPVIIQSSEGIACVGLSRDASREV